MSPKDQISFRRLNVDAFRAAVANRIEQDVFPIIDAAVEQIAGGHTVRSVRVRIGQGKFRSDLLNRYHDLCAFSGPTPEIVLDACHLYSYATVGEHKDQKGGACCSGGICTACSTSGTSWSIPMESWR